MSDHLFVQRLDGDTHLPRQQVLREITPAKACHHPPDSSRTMVNLDIDQAAGVVMFLRTRLCGTCSIILEDTQRVRKRGFPTDPDVFLVWVGVVLGPEAWHALRAAYRAERAKHWTPKYHMNLDPLGPERLDHMAICDVTGHRIDMGRVKTDPRQVTCNYCKGHKRFAEIWQEYANDGATWAQHPPETPPEDLVELVESWREVAR